MGTPDIKIITGVRSSGKHQLLDSFHEYIMNHVDNANIIHINFNLKKYRTPIIIVVIAFIIMCIIRFTCWKVQQFN